MHDYNVWGNLLSLSDSKEGKDDDIIYRWHMWSGSSSGKEQLTRCSAYHRCFHQLFPLWRPLAVAAASTPPWESPNNHTLSWKLASKLEWHSMAQSWRWQWWLWNISVSSCDSFEWGEKACWVAAGGEVSPRPEDGSGNQEEARPHWLRPPRSKSTLDCPLATSRLLPIAHCLAYRLLLICPSLHLSQSEKNKLKLTLLLNVLCPYIDELDLNRP